MKSWRIEAPLLAAVFLDLLGFGMILVDFQLRAEKLVPMGWPTGAIIGGLLAATFMIQILVSPKWGNLSDHWGRKPVLILCTILSALAMVVYAFATSVGLLLLSRVLAGLGAANVAVGQALIADSYTGKARTAALGRIGAAISVGLVFGPVLGGELAVRYGSMAVGLVGGAASLLGMLLLLILVPNPEPKEPAEATKRPVIDLSLLRDFPGLRPLALIAAVSWFSLAMLEGTFARLIKALLGYDQREFGIVFSYESALAFLVQALLLGYLVHRFKDTHLLRVSYVLQGVGLALFPLTPYAVHLLPGLAILLFASTLYAFGNSVANPTVNSLCSEVTPEERQGELFGLLQGSRSIGFAVGPMLGGALFDWQPSAPYFFAGVVCVVAAVLVPSSPTVVKNHSVTA